MTDALEATLELAKNVKMNIVNLFKSAGMLNMIVLTVLLVLVVIWAFRCYNLKTSGSSDHFESNVDHLRSIGLFAFMMGILFHLISFYHAFSIFEKVEGVAPHIFYGGLKVSMITTIYGLIIYLLSLLASFLLKLSRAS